MPIQKLSQLFCEVTGQPPVEVKELSSSGSNRRYFRLTAPDTSLVGVVGTSIPENEAFLYMSSHFAAKGLPVPVVKAVSPEKDMYLQEDLGDTLLFDAVEQGRKTGVYAEQERSVLCRSIALLPAIQFEGADGMDFSHSYPVPEFDRRTVLWDLNYFKYCFLKATGIDFMESPLEDDFERMADVLLRHHSSTFMYRDFQSRNVMLCGDKPYFIDFQGGRKGPYLYDVASFIWQAKAQYPASLKEELLAAYIEALRPYTPVDEKWLRGQLRHFVLFRTLQVLGAYGFRGYFEKKPHFMQSVPFAIASLGEQLDTNFAEYPYLAEVLRRLTELKQFEGSKPPPALTLGVYSFSYKKGIPNDPSGNGGGFVFDCRAINNPGKYERYNHFTGIDAPVIEFLEQEGEITTFLSHVVPLVEASVKRYIDRGFSSLMVSFGCTGGQHRSVYCAQHVAKLMHERYGIKVVLQHREQNIAQVFEK